MKDPLQTHKKSKLRFLSPLELLVITGILILKEEASPNAIKREIQLHTGEKVAETSIYFSLNKLRDKELIGWKVVGDPSRPRRIFTLTEKGRKLYRRTKHVLQSLFNLEELNQP